MQDGAPSRQVVEEELVFVDLPELSRFEMFEGTKTFKEKSEEVGFNLVVQPRENPEQESMTFRLQGRNMETVGTCLFFAESEENKEQDRETEVKESNRDVEMNDSCRAQSSLEAKPHNETQERESDIVSRTCKSKLVCIGKCKKVVQAFIED